MLEQLQIEHFHGSSLTEGAKIAHKNRLYVPGWCIIDKLRAIGLFAHFQKTSFISSVAFRPKCFL